MNKVKNGKCIARISRRSLSANRTRNIILIIAIALTALMLTSLFTIGGSMIKSIEKSTMYQVGSSSHGGFKFLNQEQYEKLKEYPKIKDMSSSIFVGFGSNNELRNDYTQIRYAEENFAKWAFNEPEVGRLPEKGMEIAVCTDVLDLLGVPHEIGAKVPLKIDTGVKEHSDEFVLCGFWDKQAETLANEAYVSKEYQEKVAPVWKNAKDAERAMSYNSASGSINPLLWFASSIDIEAQMNELKEWCGFDSYVNEGVNWAYASSTVDFTAVLLVVMILLLIVSSGYLIIYNIFYISISGDIRFYGLLKTIGTTTRQLKRIVYRQAIWLSIIGIPIGLLGGYLLAIVLFPTVTKSMDSEVWEIYADPRVFALSALFAFATVWLSCIKPCKLLKKLSPVEAVKYEVVSESISSKSRSRKNRSHKSRKAGIKNFGADKREALKRERKSHKVSPASMAWANIRRDPKRTIAVVLSLSLSIIMLNATVNTVKGFDLDKYLKNFVVTDFYVTDSTILSQTSSETNYKALRPQDMETLKQTPGCKNFGAIYMDEGLERLEGEALERAKEIVKTCKDNFYNESHYKQTRNMVFNEARINSHIYGIDETLYDNIEIVKGDFDKEKFESGKYVVVSAYYDTGEKPYYKQGETIKVDFADGSTKEYEVMAIGDIEYSIGPQHGHGMDIYISLPASEYMKHAGKGENLYAMKVAFDVEEARFDEATEYVSAYCEDTAHLGYKSKQDYIDSFDELKTMYMTVGGALSFILALIGFLNFANVTITSINARKREFAVLQAVGMTGKQLKSMIVREGIDRIAMTLAFVLTIGTGLTILIVKLITREMWMFSFHFVIWPVLLSIPIMLIIAALIPSLLYSKIKKKSLVERLGNIE